MKLSEKTLNVKSILLITIILPVVVIFASSIAIIITAKSVQPGSVFDISVLETDEYAVPETNEEALSQFTSLINDAVSSGIIRYSGKTEIEIRDIKCSNENAEKIFSFLSGKFSSHMKEGFEESSIKYGEDASALPEILPESTPDLYSCENENGKITLKLTYTKVFGNMYFSAKDKAAVSMLAKENESVFSSINEKLVPCDVVFTLTYDNKTKEISCLSVERAYTYSSNISFVNTLYKAGSASLSMTPVFTESYEISYAGIKIEEDIKTLTKNGYDTLTITPFTESNLSEDEYTLSFTSSDESVATVDENGQVSAVNESEKSVTVTVTLQYLGKTFTDSCKVYVVTPVEKMTVSDTAVTLKTGEKKEISGKVSPDDATIKTVLFHSSDEGVAKVSENGEITATGKGTAIITAYSEEGFIAAECTVTVTD